MDDSASQLYELTPFIHQVGGHSFMLCLDEATVCKALVPRELQFYQTLPEGIAKFTPTFVGVTQVHTITGSDDYVHFYASAPPNYKPKDNIPKRIRFKRSGSIEALEEGHIFSEENAERKSGLNPWVLKCHKESSIKDSNSTIRDFIVLENLTFRYSYPCILDLKVGTRQYGDEASLSKMQSKMVKVVSTTSAKLGLRVGGMQVYQANTRRFLCHNKFYGRSLSVSGFQQTLVHFLHNGVRFRTDVLAVLIKKLEELAEALERIDAIRFYTTSLLLIYEGRDHNIRLEEPEPLNVRQISLTRTSSRESASELFRKTISAESINYNEEGAAVSRRRTSSLERSTPSAASSNSSSSSNIFEECLARSGGKKQFRDRSFSIKSDPGGAVSNEIQVDVKMIDFAHSTHKALDDVVVYTGPDRGFLFGLEKLIAMLKTINADYC